MTSSRHGRQHNPRSTNQHGFFTIWVLMCVLIIFAFGGIGIDLWKTFAQRRDLAEIADSAAIAGASGIDLNAFQANATVQLNPADAQARANAYINNAIAQDGITLSDRQVVATAQGVNVVLSENSTLTLTKLAAGANSGLKSTNYVITVHSAAQPRVAN